jgi:hypothetical protein
VQTGIAALQAVPHAPQLLGSVFATVQPGAVAGQRKKPVVHWHAASTHTEFAPHA